VLVDGGRLDGKGGMVLEVVELRFRCGLGCSLVVYSSVGRWICRRSVWAVDGWVCVLFWRRWRALKMDVG